MKPLRKIHDRIPSSHSRSYDRLCCTCLMVSVEKPSTSLKDPHVHGIQINVRSTSLDVRVKTCLTVRTQRSEDKGDPEVVTAPLGRSKGLTRKGIRVLLTGLGRGQRVGDLRRGWGRVRYIYWGGG